MRKMILGLAVATACLAGCASMGTKFDMAAVDALTPGMSKAEVVARLGRPNSTSIGPLGGEVDGWIYSEATFLGTGGARLVNLQFDSSGRFVRVLSRTETRLN